MKLRFTMKWATAEEGDEEVQPFTVAHKHLYERHKRL